MHKQKTTNTREFKVPAFTFIHSQFSASEQRWVQWVALISGEMELADAR